VSLKVAVVGGGSTYTPELADGVARLGNLLAVDELMLVDPAAERLEIVGRFCARLFTHAGHPGRVSWTSDMDEGLDGADVVLIQLRVGGQSARISDETFPLECGCVGQETGAGPRQGAANRTGRTPRPPRAEQRAAPGAWIIDFTNPVGIVTRALPRRRAPRARVVQCGHWAAAPVRRHARCPTLRCGTESRRAQPPGHGSRGDRRRVDMLPKLLADHGGQIAAEIGLPTELLAAVASVPS
jgi:6-phospho-beta-glucosidase